MGGEVELRERRGTSSGGVPAVDPRRSRPANRDVDPGNADRWIVPRSR
jgi:hypothetical protein